MSRAAAKLKPLAPRPVDNSISAAKQCSSSNPIPLNASMPMLRCANMNAFAGCNIGVPCSPLEAVTSLDPKDYVWGTPSPQQQQLLFQQFLQMHFLYQLQLPHHQMPAMPGAPVSLPMHAFHIPPSHLLSPQPCAIFPGLSPMPGFAAPVAVPARTASIPPPQVPSIPQPTPAPATNKVEPPLPVQPKEEPVVASKPAVAACPAATTKHGCLTDCEPCGVLSNDNASESSLSLLDKADLFDCVGDFNMDVFDVMLSDHCQDTLPCNGKEQTGGLYGDLSISSPSGSDGSTETIAAGHEGAADSPTSHEALSFLQGTVDMLPLPEDNSMASLDYAADFKDVADFEFADLDDVVGFTGMELSYEQAVIGAVAAASEVAAADAPSKGNNGRGLKVKKGSGVHKACGRRGSSVTASTKAVLVQEL